MLEIKLRNSERAREDAENRNRLLQSEMEEFFSTLGNLTMGTRTNKMWHFILDAILNLFTHVSWVFWGNFKLFHCNNLINSYLLVANLCSPQISAWSFRTCLHYYIHHRHLNSFTSGMHRWYQSMLSLIICSWCNYGCLHSMLFMREIISKIVPFVLMHGIGKIQTNPRWGRTHHSSTFPLQIYLKSMKSQNTYGCQILKK